MIGMKIEGLEALQKAMVELPKELHKGPLRSAVSAGAGVVQKQAKANAPSDTGTLKKSIYRTRSKAGSNSTQETAIVGVRFGRKYRKRGQDAFHFLFLEFGTSKMSARPFLRPAFEGTKQKQIDIMKSRLAKAIEKAAAKLRSRK